MPANTVVPSDCRISEPAPVATTTGATPRINANEVIRIGRSRVRAAVTAALAGGGAFFFCLSREFHNQNRVLGRADLGAADKVALRDDADQRSGFIDHRKSTDVMLQHVVCCFDDKSVGSDGYNLPRHDLMCAHLRSPGRDKDASTRGVSMAKRIYSSQRQSRQ